MRTTYDRPPFGSSRASTALALALAFLFTAPAGAAGSGSLVVKPPAGTFKMRKELEGAHPRLHFTAADVPRLKARAKGPAKWFVDKARDSFAGRLADPKVPGRNVDDWKKYLYGFWGLSAVDILYTVEGNPRDLKTAKKLGAWLLRADGWGDDGLIISDMLTGLALTYDILYDHLTEAERARYRKRIYEGIDGLYPFFFKGSYWTTDFQNNHMHNRVHALAHGAFAIYGDDPKYDTQKHADVAVSVLRDIAKWMPADGSNHEGPGYWSYGHHWVVRSMALLAHVTGENLTKDHPHFANSHYYRLYMTAPGWKHTFGIGDSGSGGPGNLTCMAHTAAEDPTGFGQGALHELMKAAPGGFYQHTIWGLLWYDDQKQARPVAGLPLWRFWPDLEMLSIRSSWRDDATGFVFKCGPPGGHHLQRLRNGKYANVAHDHPDQNHFILFAHGKIMAEDDGYPKKKKLTRSHNTMVIDGKGQPREGTGWQQPFPYDQTGYMDDVFASESSAYAAGNASRLYKGVKKYVRHVAFVEGDYVVVYDELVGAGGAHSYDWRLHKKGTWSKLDSDRFAVVDGDVALDVSFLLPRAGEITSAFLPAELTARPCLSVTVKAQNARFLSVLVPRAGASSPVTAELQDSFNAVGVRAKAGAHNDIFAVALGPGYFSADGMRALGASALVRRKGSDVTLAMLTRGTALAMDDAVVLGASSPCNASWRKRRGTVTVEAEAPYKGKPGRYTIQVGGLTPGGKVGAKIDGEGAGSFTVDGGGVARIPVDLSKRRTILIGGGVSGVRPRRSSSGGGAAATSSAPAPVELDPVVVEFMRQSIVEGVKAGTLENVFIDMGGGATRAQILGADATGLLVKARGMETRVTWESIKPRRFYGIAKKCCKDDDVLMYYRMATGVEDDGGN